MVNCSSSIVVEFKTLIEVKSVKLKDYLVLSVFVCHVYYYIDDGKFKPRFRNEVFVGFRVKVKGFKVWSPSEVSMIVSDVYMT